MYVCMLQPCHDLSIPDYCYDLVMPAYIEEIPND